MAGVTGRTAKIAFAKFATNSWGVAASVTKGLHVLSDGGLSPTPIYVEDESMNQGFLRQAEVGDLTAQDRALEGQARYEDHNYILEACLFGSPAAVTISTSATGQTTSWKHVIDLAPNADGLGITYAVDKNLYVDELTSAKVYGLTERFGDGGILMQSFRVMGTKSTNQSSININSTLAGASYPAFGNRVFRKDGVLRVNAQSGGSLTASDAITYETWEWEFTRPQDAPHVGGTDSIHEPGDNGHPTLMARVSFPRMTTVTANSLYRYLTAGTPLKADLTFSGAYINSTDRYTRLYQFPYIEVQEWAAPLVGATQVKPSAMFKLKEASSAPTGMTGVTRPVRLTRIQVNSAAAFA